MTPIDTLYEYAGFRLAGIVHELLAGVGLPLILALGGTAFVVHAMAERGSARDLAVYLLYLVLAWWLLSPTKVQEVQAPRFVAWLGTAADHLQRRAAQRLQERFLDDPFEWERLAAMVSFARILDPSLARDAGEFLEACAKPALARAAPRGANVFRPGGLAYPEACERRRGELWDRLRDHARREPLHRSALEAARRREPAAAGEFEELYLDEIARRALDDPGSPTGEAALVAAALGEYSYTDPSQRSAAVPWWGRPFMGIAGLVAGEEILNVAVSGAARLDQWWSNAFSAKQKYYLATVYGPHVYGLTLLLVIGLFPVAGLWALLPGKWGALVNYGKVFLSVKMWPVCWAALSSFNARRSALEAFNPASVEAKDVWLALSSMYLLTPALSFLLVHLAASAMAAPFSPALPPPSGAGLGPVGPVVGAAARLAR